MENLTGHEAGNGRHSQGDTYGVKRSSPTRISSTGATDGYIVIQVDHLREPMALINNRFLTLFGCDISDWKRGDKVAS
jgi:hypothetical protein